MLAGERPAIHLDPQAFHASTIPRDSTSTRLTPNTTPVPRRHARRWCRSGDSPGALSGHAGSRGRYGRLDDVGAAARVRIVDAGPDKRVEELVGQCFACPQAVADSSPGLVVPSASSGLFRADVRAEEVREDRETVVEGCAAVPTGRRERHEGKRRFVRCVIWFTHAQ